MLTLIAIERDGTPRDYAGVLAEEVTEVLQATADFYGAIGFEEPWISYLAVSGPVPVGICSFKSQPIEGRVEIGYFTFPGHEGCGIATMMGRCLIEKAARHADVLVTAQTLCERGASHRVLEKLGFRTIGTVEHPQDGIVLEWHRESTPEPG